MFKLFGASAKFEKIEPVGEDTVKVNADHAERTTFQPEKNPNNERGVQERARDIISKHVQDNIAEIKRDFREVN